ncbi:helicase associated domain-containing protein [Streptomyces sp. NPDC001820]|uniref:helicase associated domain-containing protein n=1 Tax=Streptomyces sp. NPDC001820 TaxID=3364613 RepID=UPI0036AB5448
MAEGAAGRVMPLRGELTLSFVARIADRYHLSIRELLTAVTEVDGLQNLTGMVYPDSEIHLNAQARARVSVLAHVPLHVLERALPAWTREEPSGKYGAGPVGRLLRGEEAVEAWGPACPGCTAARTGRLVPARRYLAPEQRVCARHQYWLMYLPGTSGLPVSLASCPEVIEAHQRHVRLLRRSLAAAQAFEVARAVTGSWWEQQWPVEERLWSARLEATRPADADPGWWKVAARDLVTYPETVALARLLASRPLQQLLVHQSHGHLPYRLGELPGLLAELADQLGRPWLAHHLATVTHGPLFTWAHSCVRAQAASDPAAQKALWAVHSAHRPRPLSDRLPHPPASGAPPVPRHAKRLRGHSLQAERAFTQGLAHARAYHEEHGHLAVPKEDTPGGHPLGQWLANTRARHSRMPAHQAAALTALYPWWNAPWSTLWQRTWHQARTHAQTYGPLEPARGFPTTSYSLGEWLHLQCTRYSALHPEQQRLLAEIGIDTHTAAAARPRRRNLKAGAEEALAHARAYAAEHGGLASVTSATVHEGFRLGQWLANQRNYQRGKHRPLPAGRAQALHDIDPWWCPPWNLKWQRSYHRARDTAAGQPLHPEHGFDGLDDTTARWLHAQCRTYDQLHPDQQHLLAGIGITPETARTAQAPPPGAKARREPATPPAPKPTPRKAPRAPSARPQRARPTATAPTRPPVRPAPQPAPKAPRSRLGHRPDLKAGFEEALAHARAYAAEHGHLAVPRAARHDGYPLGAWLSSQRNRAKQRARAQLPPSPHLQELAAIDPWWNPPWDLHWQRNYHRAHAHIEAGNPFDPAALIPSPATALGTWTTRACLRYHLLHPGQQQLLNALGITSDIAHARTRRAHPWHTAVEHAKAFADHNGHLAVPHNIVRDGFPLGRWLIKQRYRTRKTGPTPAARALTAIAPYWNPPWGMTWQLAYHHAHTNPRTPATRRWSQKQRRAWHLLHPHQQQLLNAAALAEGPPVGPPRS